jgi:hypothetical protein
MATSRANSIGPIILSISLQTEHGRNPIARTKDILVVHQDKVTANVG